MAKGLPLSYVFKRLVRSWQLYIALLLGIILASTFFAGINIGADTAAKQALDQALSQTPVDIQVNTMSALSSNNITEVVNKISTVRGVSEVEAISGVTAFNLIEYKNFTMPSQVIGIFENSQIYEGWIGDTQTLNENETFVWAGSKDAGKIRVGDVLPINFTATSYKGIPENVTQLSFIVNLTVAGFVQLTDRALTIATGESYSIYVSQGITATQEPYSQNLMITSWEKTIARLLDVIYEYSPQYHNPTYNRILVFVDRASLISPWDIAGSIDRLETVTLRVNEALADFQEYRLYASSRLTDILRSYQFTALAMRFMFITASLPVFFVAWYMGSTVSDVSLNLRRREIGLLLIKGFSRRQLLGIFLTEALLIGLVGGLVGIGLGLALNPIFVRAAGGEFTGTAVAAGDTLFLTVTFAVIITFLSTFQPARKASSLATVDALREYMYIEETKPYKRTWPWVAFGLGSYKMVILLLGLNMFVEMQKIAASGSMLLSILAGIAFVLDSVLTFIGPWLFVWGTTKLLIRGSLKFQQLTSKIFKFLGDLGVLATKNVQRNPARSAAVAFLVALIIAYSFQVTGTLASQQDLNMRNILFDVGSDVSVRLGSGKPLEADGEFNVTTIINEIKKSLSDSIASITVEYFFSGTITNYGMQFKAVNPESWFTTAYYENEWFSGREAQTAFERLKSNNNTIILERGYATLFDKKLDEYITITFGEEAKELKIVGFFGNEPPTSQISTYGLSYVYFRTYWSYVPEGLLKSLSDDFRYSEARILIKLKEGIRGKEAANAIRELKLNFGTVYSVEEQLEEQKSNVISTGQLNVLRLGVIFVVVASSIGTALVTVVSLNERRRDASIMSVRGLSFKQLVVMLLSENLAIITFAVLLGATVGFLIVRGTIASSNASSYSLVNMRMVFPPDVVLILLSSFVLIFASTILPVMFMSKRFGSRLERIVRQA